MLSKLRVVRGIESINRMSVSSKLQSNSSFDLIFTIHFDVSKFAKSNID